MQQVQCAGSGFQAPGARLASQLEISASGVDMGEQTWKAPFNVQTLARENAAFVASQQNSSNSTWRLFSRRPATVFHDSTQPNPVPRRISGFQFDPRRSPLQRHDI